MKITNSNPLMLHLTGYRETDAFYTGIRTLVYRTIRLSDHQLVIIKVLRNSHPHAHELIQFRNQYSITRTLNSPYIVQPIALERYGNGYALVMPDAGGVSLAEVWQPQGQTQTLSDFLKIAIQLAEALHYLHQQRIIHKDIKPANILIHPETQQIQIIDFSIASLLPKEQQQLVNLNVLEGTLAYLSPEQTGRMNRGIDYRTDFYSLGVTLYELLTGILPFHSSDPMELIHAHLTQDCIPPQNFPDPQGVPHSPLLSEIILKLMAKNAEARYQSALGLKHDLARCLQSLEATGRISEFELGQRDVCDRFLIPERLYGREAEVQTLLAAFDRVAHGSGGNGQIAETPQSELLLVAGFSGIGKTAVVREVHKPITRQKGYFIQGKFDQFNRNIPFSAFVQAFRSLMGQLLGESDIALAKWRSQILAALGDSGQVIVDVIPELAAIIGEQPPVPQLAASAAQHRFNLLLGQFVQVFTTPEHPLVIFLDDLQWADSASLNLLKLLMAESETGYLLVLGAYRDNEVFAAHPLMMTLDEITKQGGQLTTLTLTPLDESDINQLVADTLRCDPEIAAPLSQLINQKTAGNPFFTTQFLQGLYEEGCLTFESDARYWQCDLARVRSLALTDDVVAFMVRRLRKLPPAAQSVIMLAACIGNHFDLQTLTTVCNAAQPEQVATDLWCLLQDGLVVPNSETYKFFQHGDAERETLENVTVSYRFLHDRVQQAAYSLIAEDEKQATHLKIGQLLLQDTPEDERDSRIFTIVNQLNMAIALISNAADRLQLAHLNLRAGQKAKAATAYLAASEYFKECLGLLPENSWQHHYELTLDGYVNAIECAYLNTHFSQASTWATEVFTSAQTTLDRVRVYELTIQMHVARLEMMAAMNLGLEVLELLEVTLVETPPDCTDVEALSELPELTDRYQLAVMRILMSLISSAYFADPSLLPKIIFTTIARSRLFGNSYHSAYGYVLYGLLLCGPFQDIELGYRYGQLALKLLEQFDAQEITPRVLLVFNGNVRHWKEHTNTTIQPLQTAIQIGLEVGDIEYAGYASTNRSDQLFAISQSLDEVEQTRQTYLDLMSDFSQDYSINHHRIGLQLVQNLLGKSATPTVLVGSAFDEAQMLPIFLDSRNAALLFNLYLAKGRLCYLFRDITAATQHLNSAADYIDSVAGMITTGEQVFYHSLTMLATARDCPDELEAAIAQVEINQQKMQTWAHHAPENYQHKYDLVEAEKSRVLGQKIAAIELYDLAITGAQQAKYIQEEALANELAAEFYLAWHTRLTPGEGKVKLATPYLQAAYYGYARWGATAKTKHLEQCYPQLLTPMLRQQPMEVNPNASLPSLGTVTTLSTTSMITQQLDLASLMKATWALSQDIDLESAIANFMKILQENAGAQTAVLLLLDDAKLTVTAKLIHGEQQPVTAILAQDSQAIPLSIVNTVHNTQTLLVLDNAREELTYAGDPYIQKYQPQSILCLPLLNRGQNIGILYLENNQCHGAFTPARVEVLTLLCAQAAITLENARLYQKAQQALQLEKDIHQLQRTQLHLIQSEKMYGLGQLVAGIAHEINNPVNFIHGNIDHANEYMQDVLKLLKLYQQHYPDPHPVIQEAIDDVDLPFLKTDFQDLLQSMHSGSDRIQKIITSLRTFARLDESDVKAVDLHAGLDSTLTILQNRLQGTDEQASIQVIKNYGALPLITCYAGQLNQVFMNILGNAIDALLEHPQPDALTIEITTHAEENQVRLTIADNGMGMSEDTQHRIFDPFFTTKEVGKGTGLGMAIAHQIITEKHGGTITCTSELGQGTTFTLTLPFSHQ